ncbi:hypothetical protein SO802_010915 [Lithocarpus litseifolius]|uniref:Reverse transcriptase domain-containing protein n=1 Tax=Lithocarpus litseifolius TaxID=425828 RepID=A0AAW2DII8_9ROSI
MALKIDLEKAFDRLEWSFIREVLVLFNIPPNLNALIMDCISSTFVSILFNSGKLPAFCPSRGIRQGDPLSPYIFILCLEYLGLLIRDKNANNAWKPVKASRSGPTFSHLFFADDLMLFDFHNIVHKVQEKLAGWQASLLSLVGRRTLIKSSSGTIPDYVMKEALLPSRVCKEINRANRNFLWGSTLEKRKMHLVSWNTVTRPKDHGGLACKAAKPLLDSDLRKVITTGTSTSLWYDTCISNGILGAQLIGPLNIGEQNQLVSQIIDQNRNWHFQLSFDLPENMVKLIQAIPTNINSQLGPPSGLYNSFGLPLSDWLHANCKSSLVSWHHGIPWSTLFLFGLWSIWTNRNCVTYQAKHPNQHLRKDCVAKALEFHFLTASCKPPRARDRLNAKWTKPPLGWHKLNIDASVTNGHAGVGGLIRDSNGNWVQGFSKTIGTTSVLMVELWALREGI